MGKLRWDKILYLDNTWVVTGTPWFDWLRTYSTHPGIRSTDLVLLLF